MQITSSLLQRLSPSVHSRATSQEPVTQIGSVEKPQIARIDFSNVTARQVSEYVDDLMSRGEIDPDDAHALALCMPSAWYQENFDTPFNLRAEIESIRDFDKAHGFDFHAAFYEGLLQRMKLMEDRSVHVSIVA